MKHIISLLIIGLAFPYFSANMKTFAQGKVCVCLDNYYNHETNPTTGKPYHYLWSDHELSGFSQWGGLFIKEGARLATLSTAPDPKALSQASIYIIVDPDDSAESNHPHFMNERTASVIQSWVRKGGILVLMSNDSANCDHKYFNILADKFGLSFANNRILHVTGRNYRMGSMTLFPDFPIFTKVHKIYMKDACSISLTNGAAPVLKWHGYVVMGTSRYGSGRVIAIGDPWIYNEYIDHAHLPESFDNYRAAKNFTTYLIGLAHPVSFEAML